MGITLDTVTALAPDQTSLNAANKLMKPGKWPLRQLDGGTGLVWGECQGSGANPYRVVFDENNHGYKCTCPSRKFPCKHVLSLMWMYADTPDGFGPGEVPDWVNDWMGRRRNTDTQDKTDENGASKPKKAGKSLTAATLPEAEKKKDPKAEARAKAAAEKRKADTEAALHNAVADLEIWIGDQLRAGLSSLLGDLAPRCRTIAARMVDGKAGALAGRLDELPSELMGLPGEEQLDALVAQLGKLIILARAFRANPNAPDIRRAIASSENRDDIIENSQSLRIKGRFEVAGERIKTRRDGLVSQATWLINLQDNKTGENEPRFALLLDFFPASVGKRSSAFAPGEQFEAELAYYPGANPLRAVLVDRKPAGNPAPWPKADDDLLAAIAARENRAPWETITPMMLPDGRIVHDTMGKPWWRAADETMALPLEDIPLSPVFGMRLERSAALWDGARLSILAAQSDWGRVAPND